MDEEAFMCTISLYSSADIIVGSIMVLRQAEEMHVIFCPEETNFEFVCKVFHMGVKGQFIVQPDSEVFTKFNI